MSGRRDAFPPRNADDHVAVALAAGERQAKNKQLEIDASEIRFRAKRRVGEMMEQQRETVGLATVGTP